jgi:chaperonin GroES|tara:strand:+ start:158 stop:442 length:285 start_codon:yes stop_codon:yes gene_type:complete
MIKPLGNRIFLLKDKQLEKKGEIILLKKEGEMAPPYGGTIIAIGDGVEDKDYKVGMKVLFHDLAGLEFEYNGEKVLSLRERDITAIIDKKVQIS